MAHPYYHALSSEKKWGGTADDYLPLHQWLDESKAITADFRHRALRHHAEGIFMLERFFGPTVTLSTGRIVPVRLIGEQHVIEDLGFIPGFPDWCAASDLNRGWAARSRSTSKWILSLPPPEPFPSSSTIRKPGPCAGLSHSWRSSMAVYYSPTVIQPPIPVSDMTPLERLVLTAMFDAEPDGGALYFYRSDGPTDIITRSAGEIRAAINASPAADSTTSNYVAERLPAEAADDAEIDIDLSGTSWEFIFRDIVRRSAALTYVTVVTSFMCSRMRPDGFGGMAVLITAEAVIGKSTGDILADLVDQAEHGSITTQSESGVHVLLRLREMDVRDQIPHVLEADETLAKISDDAVTDADIRTACLDVVERTDLNEEQGSAIFHAALAAIHEAAGRLASGD